MNPSDILSDEHRVIERVLDCLEKMAEQAEGSGQVDVDSAEQAIDFFRNFADRCHHGKEEVHFFPAMEARGFPRDGGPTGVMLQEHEVGRQRVAGMRDALAAAKGGDRDAPRQFSSHARAYIAMLRNHIDKEDHCLFPMANHALTEADQRQLLDAFVQTEAVHIGAGVHERYLRLANGLVERFRIAPSEVPTSVSQGCCGH